MIVVGWAFVRVIEAVATPLAKVIDVADPNAITVRRFYVGAVLLGLFDAPGEDERLAIPCIPSRCCRRRRARSLSG